MKLGAVRLVLYFVIGTALFFMTPCGKAWADPVEFCPARLDAIHAFRDSNDGLVAFYVAAESARSVSANVIVQTQSNWYTFQFNNAVLLPDLAHYQNSTVRFDRTLYHTKPLYVRLPAGDRIVRWWIYDAIATGDSVFGWDKRGDVTCFPQPEGVTKFRPLGDPPRRTNPLSDLSQLPGPSDSIIAVAKIAPPAEITECAIPFVPAAVLHAVQPLWPQSVSRIPAPATTEIEVAVDAKGSLAGAWVYTPSGYPALDLEALKAAELSKYRGGIALCKPAPGNYLFRADFEP